jgi:hypothetical protein
MPKHFIATCKQNPLTEPAGARPHLADLGKLLGVGKPGDPDSCCFERGAGRPAATAGPAYGSAASTRRCSGSPTPS